jgi:primosomal protein N' (replication factor Y)
LAILRFESEEETLANQEADKATERLRTRTEELGHGVSVLGPAPAPLARLKGIYRVQVLLKSSSRRQLREVLSAAGGKRKSGIRQILDVDPVSML